MDALTFEKASEMVTQMEPANKVGRPPEFKTPEEFKERVIEYFHQIGSESDTLKETRPTITGLCLFLGFETRQSFYDYEQKEEFTYTVKRARLMIENKYEGMLGTIATTGAIFALKQFGWVDKQEFDHTSKGNEIQPFTLIVKKDEQ